MPSSRSARARAAVDKPVEKVDNSPKQKSASSVLGVFCKDPLAGQVKTRLCPPLTPQQAADLYRVSLTETLQRFRGQEFELVICYAGGPDYFTENFPDIRRQPQVGPDLGARMAGALAGFLAEGYSAAALIGSDSPDLPLATVSGAFEALQRSEVVISPASDGGYVLIGERRHQPLLFEAMPWSQEALMSRTRQLLAQQKIPWQELPGWEDVDDAASILRLLGRSPGSAVAQHVRRQLKDLFDDLAD